MADRRTDRHGAGSPVASSHERTGGQDTREFVSEAEDTLEQMRESLSRLHDQRAEAGEVDPDLVNRLFRAAHSLKGLAGMFEFDAVGALAHRLEDILDGLRLGRIAIDSPVVPLLDEGVALFAAALSRIEQSGSGTTDLETSVREIVARLERGLAASPVASGEGLDGLGLADSELRALTEYEEHRLRENLRQGRHLSRVETTFEISAFEDGLAEISAAIREVGEVVSTLPSPGPAPESQICFALLVGTNVSAEHLAERLDFPDTRVVSIQEGRPPAAPAPKSAAGGHEPAGEVETRFGDRSAEHESAGPVPEIESLRSISETVRVDIRKLDELMNLVGELVIQRNAIEDVALRLNQNPGTARIGAELGKVHKAIDRKLKSLQSGVLDVRMVPMRQVFEKLSRVARRLHRDLGKDPEVNFKGADTELDKLIVEQLVDPLVELDIGKDTTSNSASKT